MRSICYAFVVLLIPAPCLALSEPTRQASQASKGFELEVVATTMTQIVVQWRGEPPQTASFELERAVTLHPSARVSEIFAF